MVIGFAEVMQCVSENEIPGRNEFFVFIDLNNLRVSEREHGLFFPTSWWWWSHCCVFCK